MKRLLALAMVVAGLLCAGAAVAEEKDGFWHADRDQMYGRELMSPEERQQYRQKLWEFETEVERERFRSEHRSRMEERARTLGIPLPEDRQMVREAEVPDKEKWPDDGLRRWPQERSGSSGLRRWPPSAPADDSGPLRTWRPGTSAE